MHCWFRTQSPKSIKNSLTVTLSYQSGWLIKNKNIFFLRKKSSNNDFPIEHEEILFLNRNGYWKGNHQVKAEIWFDFTT